jgi:uncharacterized heparinase superfamily protein
MLNKALLLFNTVKYLKASQILNRVKRKFIKPKLSLFSAPEIASISNNIQPVIQCQQKMYDSDSFKFLNKEYTLRGLQDWNSTDQDKLWLYNLHYFDDLNSIGADQRLKWHCNLIQRWINENPPGFGNGWEAYPSSLRTVNWIKWSLVGNGLEQEWLESLAIQVRYLSNNLETHLLGNHLFANAKALMFAGLFFNGKEANNWYQTGLNIIEKELPEQVLADGGNFELSTMYHAIFLEDLLDLVNIHKAYNRKLPNNVENKILQMFDWLKAMCHPDGGISFFNDTAFGIASSLDELLDYGARLNIALTDDGVKAFTHLPDSGYIRVQKENLVSIIDVASIGPDYIPGHGHADTLSFELSLFGRRIIVNSGTSIYGTGAERHKQRSTSSHSTVIIDEQNSSEVWDSFRVARRARVFNIENIQRDNNIKVSACHDGYGRLKGKPIHCRDWIFSENTLEIVDKITGEGEHKIKSILPLHPEVVIIKIQHNCVELQISGRQVNVEFEGCGKLQVISSKYHPEFGLSINNKQIIYDYNGTLPLRAATKVSW